MKCKCFSAFKHYKRADFANKNLAKITVDALDKSGVHWLWLTGKKVLSKS